MEDIAVQQNFMRNEIRMTVRNTYFVATIGHVSESNTVKANQLGKRIRMIMRMTNFVATIGVSTCYKLGVLSKII